MFYKKLFIEISQYSQENTCVREFLFNEIDLIKLGLQLC